MNAFDPIKADDALKQKTLEAAKAGKQVKQTHPIRWSVLSSVAALLVVTIGVSLAWAGGVFGHETDRMPENDFLEEYAPSYALYRKEGAPALALKNDSFGSSSYESRDSAAEPVPEPDDGAVKDVEPSYQVGTLTAARLNDNEHYEEFVKSWKEAQRTQDAFGMNALHRIAVTVQNEQGQPLFNAQTVLLHNGQDVFRARTNAQGRAYLFYSWSKSEDQPDGVNVTFNGQSVTASLDGKDEIAVTVQSEAQHSAKLDLMFMIDTTGSMGDELEYLKIETEAMIRNLQTKTDTRISMNFYRDEGDEYVIRPFDFSDSVSAAIEQLRAQASDGGGDIPEAVDQALKNAVFDHVWRDDAVKVMFLVLDAPAHEEDNVIRSLRETITEAAEKGVRIVPVMSSDSFDTVEDLCRHLALFTGGQFVFLTDDSGVGNAHREPNTTVPYEVKPLIDILNDIVAEYTAF